MSGLEVISGITDRVWPINTVESRRTFPSKVKNLHTAVNKNNLEQICISSNRKPVYLQQIYFIGSEALFVWPPELPISPQ